MSALSHLPYVAAPSADAARTAEREGMCRHAIRVGPMALLRGSKEFLRLGPPKCFQRFHPRGSDVEDPNGPAANRVCDVVFEARKVTAPDVLGDHRAGERMPSYSRLPGLIFVQECAAEVGGGGKLASGGNQFLLRQPVKRYVHRMACRAFRRTAAEGAPTSPSTSICSARIALTVASSRSSSRR